MENVSLWRIFGIKHQDADISSRIFISNAVTVHVTKDMKFLTQSAYLYITGGYAVYIYLFIYLFMFIFIYMNVIPCFFLKSNSVEKETLKWVYVDTSFGYF
jgi:hypothetical protein